MMLDFKPLPNECAEDTIRRLAGDPQVARKALKIYQMEIGNGASEYIATFQALYHFDLLEVVDLDDEDNEL